jgi:hypothetical protein
LALVTVPTLSAASGAANAHASTASLTSLVVAGPPGYKSEAIDKVSRDRTGRINIKVAASADCDPTTLSPKQWRASVLRYFDNDRARPMTTLILCVTQLRTPADATAVGRRLLAAIGSSAVQLKDIPGATLHAVGTSEQIFFAKGDYFVRVVSTDSAPQTTAMALTLGSNLAHREYVRLP